MLLGMNFSVLPLCSADEWIGVFYSCIRIYGKCIHMSIFLCPLNFCTCGSVWLESRQSEVDSSMIYLGRYWLLSYQRFQMMRSYNETSYRGIAGLSHSWQDMYDCILMIEIKYSFIRGMALWFLREWWVWSEIQKDNVEYVIDDTWDKCLYSSETIFVLEMSYSLYELDDFWPMDWLELRSSSGKKISMRTLIMILRKWSSYERIDLKDIRLMLPNEIHDIW